MRRKTIIFFVFLFTIILWSGVARAALPSGPILVSLPPGASVPPIPKQGDRPGIAVVSDLYERVKENIVALPPTVSVLTATLNTFRSQFFAWVPYSPYPPRPIREKPIQALRDMIVELYVGLDMNPRPVLTTPVLRKSVSARFINQLLEAAELKCEIQNTRNTGFVISGGRLLSFAKSNQPWPDLCPQPPTNLVLTHTNRNKFFTVSWLAGSGNGGAGGCYLQFEDGGIWNDIISASSVDCDSPSQNSSYELEPDGWKVDWGGTRVRIVRVSDSVVVGTFSQTLACTSTGSSSSSTPNIDEDCNGYWDNTTFVWSDARCPSSCTSAVPCVKRRMYRYGGTGCVTTADDSQSQFRCDISVQGCTDIPGGPAGGGTSYKDERISDVRYYW